MPATRLLCPSIVPAMQSGIKFSISSLEIFDGSKED